MERYFNTTGPVRSDEHYCLDPLSRFDLNEILDLIDRKRYFGLHAPRQTGKTTCLLALQEYLNHTGHYHCLYCNVEGAQAARENVAQAMHAIWGEMARRASQALDDPFLLKQGYDAFAQFGVNQVFNAMLTAWAEAAPLPPVILIDEIDALIGDTLISVLRQIRSGYDKRPRLFPQSVVLCGVRDVRDYRLHSSTDKAVITGGSAFNIKAKSLRLGNFSQAEVERLYQQHTDETGQQIEPDAMNLVWELTQGQPWLVNALGEEVCFEMRAGRDRQQPITADMLLEAKERLMLRRETHLDQLVDKLQEARVRRVISPMLQGRDLDESVGLDDIQYVIDLGLVERRTTGLQIANPIYREIIPRELNFITQLNFESIIQPNWYLATDGRLDMIKLLTAFQQFFREHAEHWVERFDYKEAGPQLLLQAFLQRIVNGGGRIDREYGLGRKRTDLLMIWPYSDGQTQRVALELKIQYKSLEHTMQEGLAQTWEYMDRCGTSDGQLLIFNRDPAIPWDAKIFRREERYQQLLILVWGM